MSKLYDFIKYLNEQAENHSIYVWGAQGQKGPQITEAWIRGRENSAANANRAIAYWKKQVAAGYGDRLSAFDCSGLGIYWLFNHQHLYPGDTTANGMYGRCKQKLTRTTWKCGEWVFRGSASKKTHIGYIVDDKGTVVEAQGRDAGVCKTNIATKASGGAYYWQYFARPDVFKSDIEGKPDGPAGYSVEVIGGSVYIRNAPDTSGKILKTAHKGDVYKLLGKAATGWYEIDAYGAKGFISNKADLTRVV